MMVTVLCTSIMNKSLCLCFFFLSDSIMNKMDLHGHLLCVMKLDMFCMYVCELLKLNTLKIQLRNNVISATPPFQKSVFDLRLNKFYVHPLFTVIWSSVPYLLFFINYFCINKNIRACIVYLGFMNSQNILNFSLDSHQRNRKSHHYFIYYFLHLD